jgi:hypothetical protein
MKRHYDLVSIEVLIFVPGIFTALIPVPATRNLSPEALVCRLFRHFGLSELDFFCIPN